MAKKKLDPFQAKQRKQKILAAVLGVVFLGVAGFQGPRMWKQLHPPAPPAPHTETTAAPPAGTPTLAAPTLGGAQASPAASGSGSLVSSSAPAMQEGQLASFSRFASKDPFAQQITERKKDTAETSSGGSVSGGSVSGGGGSSTGSLPTAGGKEPNPGTAVISVNGTLYTVPVGTDFPQASATDSSIVPLFHLISVTAHTAKISIVGGSYSNGAAAVTLKENTPMTLMNTADGTRYKLILKPVGTSVPSAAAPTSTTSTTVTVPPPSSP
jgi:hypothetical protein